MRADAWAVLLASAVLLVCGSCAVETTRYGGTEALAQKSFPAPDGPLPPPDTNADVRACATQVTPGPDCDPTVKWVDIHRDLIVNAWKCAEASSCHGGTTPPQISASNPVLARAQLLRSQLKPDVNSGIEKYYIDHCSNNPAASSITCNIKHEANTTPCGTGMPFPAQNVTPVPPTKADMDRIAKWLACGAPAD